VRACPSVMADIKAAGIPLLLGAELPSVHHRHHQIEQDHAG
jgi:hypothetical protein